MKKLILALLLLASPCLASTIINPASSGGTVNSGTAGQSAYYATGGTAVSGTSSMLVGTSSVTIGSTAFGLNVSSTVTMNSNKITGLANGTASTDGAAFGQIPVISSWTTYTPSFTGFGTVTNIQMYWRQVRDTLEIMGSWSSGTTTNVAPVFTIPSGLAMAGGSNLILIGVWAMDSAGSVNSTNLVLGINGATNVQFARSSGSGISPLAALAGNGSLADNTKYSVKLSVIATGF